VQTAGNLKIRISKALNAGMGKREDLYETEDLEKIRDPERTGDPGKREGKSAYRKLPIQQAASCRFEPILY